MSEVKTYRVLSLGAGVQSTVLYLQYDFDVAIFADTQDEPDTVYQHLDWLKSLGRSPIWVRTAGCLGDQLMRGTGHITRTGRHRYVSIPAFLADDVGNRNAIQRRQCTSEYKVDVIERTIRRELIGLAPGRRIPKDVTVEQFYGISIDEAARAVRLEKQINTKHSRIRPKFPLIEQRWSRKDCKNWLAAYGIPHETPRSACVFCPYKSNAEWRRLRDGDPRGWMRAVAIDHALRDSENPTSERLRGHRFLHSSCLPLDQADLNNDQWGKQYSLGFSHECMGMCGL